MRTPGAVGQRRGRAALTTIDGSGAAPGGYLRAVTTSTVRRSPTTGEAVVAGVIFAGATAAVAGIGGLATSGGMDWYDTLDKPDFTPPGATFGIVWTILYVAIAVAGWLAWRASGGARPTMWWGIQMGLNLLWTAVFFGLESPLGGVVVIAALIGAVVMDLRASAAVDTTAASCCSPTSCGAASRPRSRSVSPS